MFITQKRYNIKTLYYIFFCTFFKLFINLLIINIMSIPDITPDVSIITSVICPLLPFINNWWNSSVDAYFYLPYPVFVTILLLIVFTVSDGV